MEDQSLTAFLDAAPDAIIVVDGQGRITRANGLAEAMFGYPPGGMVGEAVEVLVPERFRRTHVPDREHYIQEPRTRPMGAGQALTGLRRDGSEFPVEISLSPLKTAAGTHVISIVRDTTERRETEARITASLREKEALLKEIHHRVKNNLQVVSSLLRLQERDINDEHTRELFAESQRRIQSMALVHEKLYSSGDLARIDFADYTRSLSTLLFRSFGVMDGSVNLRIDAPEAVFLSVDTAVPCGLIVNELVTNSLKHAFPFRRRDAAGAAGQDAGIPEIAIGIRRDPSDRVTLRIADNGAGADLQATAESETLGLRLVRTLVRQLNADLSITADRGLAFTIVFGENG